ncbi:MAG TPA: Pr6Pr family membrane protein [Bryobacteraceae bacterium]|jgi:small basic protein|nr:Pr6Pr family membrane protein [Bryobacteraceae bacterium]
MPAAPPFERIYAAILALIGWAAIVVQCYWAIEIGVGNGLSLAMAITNVLSYFTILTNILVAACLTASVFQIATISAGAKTALASYILIVGFVYELALRRLWNPEGLHLVVDVVLHYLVPLGYFTYWLLFVNKSGLRYRMVTRWTIYPFLYLFYTLFRGQVYGFFPYPFLNFRETGWPRLFLNVCALILLFTAAGSLLVSFGRYLQRSGFAAYRSPKT